MDRNMKVGQGDEVREHADEIRKQIAMKEENEKLLSRQKYEAGKKIKDHLKKEQETLSTLKQEKLQVMKELGIPEKYQVDLVKLKV